MRDHPYERLHWWETTLIKGCIDERLHWWKTTLRKVPLMKYPTDEKPPWWKTALMRDHTNERPHWWKTAWWNTTLMRDHPDEKLHWGETTLLKNHLIKDCLDVIPPWRKAALMETTLRRLFSTKEQWKGDNLFGWGENIEAGHKQCSLTFSEIWPFRAQKKKKNSNKMKHPLCIGYVLEIMEPLLLPVSSSQFVVCLKTPRELPRARLVSHVGTGGRSAAAGSWTGQAVWWPQRWRLGWGRCGCWCWECWWGW